MMHFVDDPRMKPYLRTLREVGPLTRRHFFVLVNGILFGVVSLLCFFGEMREGIFLGVIVFLNTLVGIIQGIQARFALERLQFMTALRVRRKEENGDETLIAPDEVRKGDHLLLRIGDQVPGDGTLVISHALEISEALITGESASMARTQGDSLSAGSIVTSGSGEMLVSVSWAESRISQMTSEAKQYVATRSPMEEAIDRVILYSGYVLLVCIGVVLVRGVILHAPWISIINQIGALASVIVPQGLVVITTLFFAFGAASYSRRHVLFQEINATEKLGRIVNLCLDKTGTLTSGKLTVEGVFVPPGVEKKEFLMAMSGYVRESGDRSSTIDAAGVFLKDEGVFPVARAISFSSWRQFGAVVLSFGEQGTSRAMLVGAPDVFLPHIASETERSWLQGVIDQYSPKGKRLLCAVLTSDDLIPSHCDGTTLTVFGVFVFEDTLREGINEAIMFFQDRGVRIRVISGDHPETVRVVARSAGVKDADRVVSGQEMSSWTSDDYLKKSKEYTVFARVTPEQKVRLISAIKSDGFTAMVGDGANDALALKRADLGIAMFDGAPATRQLAGVVLMNNSFTALPGAVRLADNFIRHIELFASIFLNQAVLGLSVFVLLSFLGYDFPLAPLHVTFLNYFAVGIPGMLIGYSALRGAHDLPVMNAGSFLSRIMFFPLILAPLGAVSVLLLAFLFGGGFASSSTPLPFLASFIVFGLYYVAVAPGVYDLHRTLGEWIGFIGLILFESGLLWIVFRIPELLSFFDIDPSPSLLLPLFPLSATLVLSGVLFVVGAQWSQKHIAKNTAS